MFRLHTAFLVITLLCAYDSNSQEYLLNGDTIKVSPRISAAVLFPSELGDVTCLCGDDDYDIRQDNNKLTIKLKSKRTPQEFCPVLVPEGKGSSARNHLLILAYVLEMDPMEAKHDYSTKSKLGERVKYLENARKNPPSNPETVQKAVPSVNGPQQTIPAPVKQEVHVPTPTEAIAADAVIIPGITNEEIRARLRNRIENFYLACENLANKVRIPYSIDYGMRLFNNKEDKEVQWTNSKGEVKHAPIRDYLNRLTTMRYAKVKMTSSEVQYVSEIHKGEDGKYYGVAQIIQDFKGYTDGNILAYIDKTEKIFKYEVVLIEQEKDGKIIHEFEVYLGNILVQQVK